MGKIGRRNAWAAVFDRYLHSLSVRSVCFRGPNCHPATRGSIFHYIVDQVFEAPLDKAHIHFYWREVAGEVEFHFDARAAQNGFAIAKRILHNLSRGDECTFVHQRRGL